MHAAVAGHGVVGRPEAPRCAEGVLVGRAAPRLVVQLDGAVRERKVWQGLLSALFRKDKGPGTYGVCCRGMLTAPRSVVSTVPSVSTIPNRTSGLAPFSALTTITTTATAPVGRRRCRAARP